MEFCSIYRGCSSSGYVQWKSVYITCAFLVVLHTPVVKVLQFFYIWVQSLHFKCTRNWGVQNIDRGVHLKCNFVHKSKFLIRAQGLRINKLVNKLFSTAFTEVTCMAYTNTHMHTHIHTHTPYTYTHTLHIHTNKHIHKQTHTHTYTNTHTHTHTRKLTHRHTHVKTYTYTHTHTHNHTHSTGIVT